MSELVDVSFRAANASGPEAGSPPVVGAGRLEVRPDGVRIRGRRSRRTIALLIGIVLGLIGLTFAIVILTMLGFEPKRGLGKLAFPVGLIAGILPGWFAYSFVVGRLRGAAVDEVVPWTALRVLSTAPGRVELRLFTHELRGDVVITANGPGAEVLARFAQRVAS